MRTNESRNIANGHRILKLSYYNNDTLCSEVWADYTDHTVRAVNHTDNIIRTAFGVATSVTWEMYEEFLESRYVPQTQGGIKERLRVWGIPVYDPLEIIQKTGGRLTEDKQWIRIEEVGQE